MKTTLERAGDHLRDAENRYLDEVHPKKIIGPLMLAVRDIHTYLLEVTRSENRRSKRNERE